MRARLTFTLLAIATLLLVPQAAFAHTAQATAPEGGLGYVLAAFGLAWVLFFAYVFYIERKSRQLRRDLDALRREVAEHKPSTQR
jgi:CcmD family protein